MVHRLSPQAELDLMDIALYIAKQSGSAEIADRQIDAITERCYLLAHYPSVRRARWEQAGEPIPLTTMSSCTAWSVRTC